MSDLNTEKKKVRMRIISRMTDPQGEVYESKHARSGLLARTAEGLVLEYDDEQDGERAHIELTLRHTAEGNSAFMLRKGMTSGKLSFLPGQRVASAYITLYGEIPLQIDTRYVSIDEQENGGRLLLDYDVYMGAERTSRALMEIAWRL